jgi:hypothetical protein
MISSWNRSEGKNPTDSQFIFRNGDKQARRGANTENLRYPSDEMEFYPVSREVNAPAVDKPSNIEPIEGSV